MTAMGRNEESVKKMSMRDQGKKKKKKERGEKHPGRGVK